MADPDDAPSTEVVTFQLDGWDYEATCPAWADDTSVRTMEHSDHPIIREACISRFIVTQPYNALYRVRGRDGLLRVERASPRNLRMSVAEIAEDMRGFPPLAWAVQKLCALDRDRPHDCPRRRQVLLFPGDGRSHPMALVLRAFEALEKHG